MGPLFRFILGKKYKYYMDFKACAPNLSDIEINKYYSLLADTFIERETDCNKQCIEYILNNIYGDIVLDAGGGNGYLAKKIYEKRKGKIYLLDIVQNTSAKGIKITQGSVCDMPFENNFFDTVICTHTLEHIKDNQKALEELRRVCRKRLIIVLPKQREYKYTFDLHLHFFPYEWNVKKFVGNQCKIQLLSGDWLIVEDF